MGNTRRKIERLLVIFIFLSPLSVIPTAIFGWEAGKKSEEKLEGNTDFDLSIKGGNISLSAKDASLKEILREIGRKMKVEVVGYMPEGEKVSVEFDKLSIVEALEKLVINYGYIMDSEGGERKIVKIIVLPRGKETMPSTFSTREFISTRESNNISEGGDRGGISTGESINISGGDGDG